MHEWIEGFVEDAGYPGIALLMFLETIFPPLPSELIMPLAGYVAADGTLHIAGVILSGIAGAVAGAVFWYSIAKIAGEKRLKRWARNHGRWVTLHPQEIGKANRWFKRHGSRAIVFAHLIPAVRTLISLPAGFFGTPPIKFIALTTAGAGLWTLALGSAGYLLQRKFSQVEEYLGPVTTAIMISIAVYYCYRVITFKRLTK